MTKPTSQTRPPPRLAVPRAGQTFTLLDKRLTPLLLGLNTSLFWKDYYSYHFYA